MFTLILALDVHGLIGKDNDLPWHFPEDLKYFKERTLNKKVLMGKKTFESILTRLNKPLPKRQSIVVTRSDFTYDGVQIVNDLEAFLQQSFNEEVFIIGGKQIFDQALKYADRMYVTHIKHLYQGDTFMNIDYSLFNQKVIHESEDLIYVLYERKSQ
ncbi:MAG: dihydrofolate reductase [Tenericutes bacterium]|jgi:dihydrofolate reductase|nr:dihydrofolate reductase [Mycoplasmatota bacterium]